MTFSRFSVAMLAALFIPSCAPHVRVVAMKSVGENYQLRELRVTGRPVLARDDFYPTLRIEGFNKPDGSPFFINSSLPDEELERKLDPGKTYRFLLHTTDQTRGKNDHLRCAILWKAEDHETLVLDASVCDVHRLPMNFVPAQDASFMLRSPKERRSLETNHNHGYVFSSCCSGGLNRYYTWRCSACAKKVDGFSSKFEP